MQGVHLLSWAKEKLPTAKDQSVLSLVWAEKAYRSFVKKSWLTVTGFSHETWIKTLLLTHGRLVHSMTYVKTRSFCFGNRRQHLRGNGKRYLLDGRADSRSFLSQDRQHCQGQKQSAHVELRTTLHVFFFHNIFISHISLVYSAPKR